MEKTTAQSRRRARPPTITEGLRHGCWDDEIAGFLHVCSYPPVMLVTKHTRGTVDLVRIT